MVPDDTLPRGVSCALEVKTARGKVLNCQVDHPRGSIANPMTEAEMNRKVHMLGDPVIVHEAVDALIGFVNRVETCRGSTI